MSNVHELRDGLKRALKCQRACQRACCNARPGFAGRGQGCAARKCLAVLWRALAAGVSSAQGSVVEESQVFTATENEGASPDPGRTVQELRTPDSGSIPNQEYRQLGVYLA